MALHPSPGHLYRAAVLLEKQSEHIVLGPTASHTHWTASARHKTGAFYTPPHLVQFVIAQTLMPLLSGLAHRAQEAYSRRDLPRLRQVVAEARALRVVDPACGCGRFLLPAFRALRDLHVWLAQRELKLAGKSDVGWPGAWTKGTQRALLCIEGMDLNAQAIAAVRQVLLQAAGLAAVSNSIEDNSNVLPGVAAGDGLAPKNADSSSWHVVIGNPPWGAVGATAPVARQIGLPAANANTFGLFLKACLGKLAVGGRLGFVLPRNFCKGNDYSQLRTQMLQENTLEWLVDAGRAFPGVLQEVVVLVVRRRTERECVIDDTNLAKLSPIDHPQHWRIENLRHIPQSVFAQAPGSILPVNMSLDQLSICARMEAAAQELTLRQCVSWARGLEYGKDGALIRCPECGGYTSLPKKKQAMKACAGCGASLTATRPDYTLITSTKDQSHTVPIYAGLHVRRYMLAPSYWADPAVPGVKYKNPVVFRGPKLLVPKIAPFLAAALDETDAWTTQGVYVLRSAHPQWDNLSLLALLNSAPLAFYYQCRYNDRATLTTNVTLANMLRLPVPPMEKNPQLLSILREGALRLAKNEAQEALSNAKIAIEEEIDTAVGALFELSSKDMEHIEAWRLEQQP